MSLFRHREIYRSDLSRLVRERRKRRPRPHRLDEFPAGYSSAGCSPAVGHQTGGLDNQARNKSAPAASVTLEWFGASAVKTAGSLVLSQARPAVWFLAPCSIQ